MSLSESVCIRVCLYPSLSVSESVGIRVRLYPSLSASESLCSIRDFCHDRCWGRKRTRRRDCRRARVQPSLAIAATVNVAIEKLYKCLHFEDEGLKTRDCRRARAQPSLAIALIFAVRVWSGRRSESGRGVFLERARTHTKSARAHTMRAHARTCTGVEKRGHRCARAV